VLLDEKKFISLHVSRETLLSDVRQLKDNQFFLNKSGFPIAILDEIGGVTIDKLLSEDNIVKMETQAKEQKKPLLDAVSLPVISTANQFQIPTPTPSAEYRVAVIPKTPQSDPSSTNQICNPMDFDINKWQSIFKENNLFKGIIFTDDKHHPISNSHYPVLQFNPNIVIPNSNKNIMEDNINIYNDISIKAYSTSNERRYTLIKSKLVKLTSSFRCPFISFTVGSEDKESKMTDSQTKTLYTTCIWSFPRVEVHLFDPTLPTDQQYLIATDKFQEEVKKIVDSTASLEDQYGELEKIFKRYGQSYPQSVILGGHLQQTDIQTVHKIVDEDQHEAIVCGQFKAFIEKIKHADVEIGLGGGQTSYDNNRKEQTSHFSLSQCDATGGNTLLIGGGKIGDWISSVGNSTWWRIIQYGEIIPTCQLLDKELQKKIEAIEQYHNKSFCKLEVYIPP
jgi:hypothetical protein